MERKAIVGHQDLRVYRMSFDAAMRIFELSKKFPVEERYSLTDQIRRSSRSVCANAGVEQAAETAAFPPANLAEAWQRAKICSSIHSQIK